MRGRSVREGPRWGAGGDAPAAAAGRLLAELRAASDPRRREKARTYFPSRLEVLGVSVPALRAVLRPVARAMAHAPPEEVLALGRALAETGVHEARQLAYELVGGRADLVARLGAREVEALGRGNDNWASVDGFAVFVCGPAWRDGRVGDRDVLRWAASEDPWWRRTALVSTVPLNLRSRGGSGDRDRTLEVCRVLSSDPHPMVAKGLSWALRALVAVDRDAVASFLDEQGPRLPALVRREVGNKLRTGLKSGDRG